MAVGKGTASGTAATVLVVVKIIVYLCGMAVTYGTELSAKYVQATLL